MFRRIFLIQILLGLIIIVMEKLGLDLFKQNGLTAPLFERVKPIKLFVDPINGNDTWSGRQATVNEDGNDGALATIEQAKIIVRKLTSQPNHHYQPIKIMLRGGTHFLPQPLIFESEDSGSISQPIVYQSYHRERAIISGGQLITGWRRETVNGIKMWTAQLPETEGKFKFQHLWIDGKRRQRSRYPSQGYLKIKKPHGRKGKKLTDGNSQIEYFPGDLPEIDLSAFKGAEVVVMTRWTDSHIPLAKINPAKRLLHFRKTSVLKLAPGDLYYLENSLAWLDNPGEWYLDRQLGKIYYLPLPEEEIDNIQAVAPLLDTLMILKGDAGANKPVKHLKFKNLTFSHSDWHLPLFLSGYNQNAWQVPAAIRATATNYCIWNQCTFSHLGNHALGLGEDCQHNRITYSSFSDLGGSGIKIGHKHPHLSVFNSSRGTHHNLIVNNHIYNGGKFFHSAPAIAVVKSHDNFIARNHIHDYYYTGITLMGNWGFQATPAYGNVVQHNHIHHIGKLSSGDGAILSDMGGVYVLGYQKGTRIQHNRIHDIAAVRYGGWGIYLDEGSSYVLVENNLVYRTSHGGFCQHYGKKNIIRHNIFAFGKYSQIHRHKKDLTTAKKKDFVSFHFEHNIVYWKEGKLLSGMTKNYQSHAVFDRNIYWKVGSSKFKLGNLSWQEWHKADRQSKVIDPLFVDPEAGDFRLQSDSIAQKLNIGRDNF